ncbi:MAG: glycosyltransferase family 2 protein [Acidobacteria bacterium]|nr:glycosyltransferase family 2 protein [Acidobacteriota bacterium]
MRSLTIAFCSGSTDQAMRQLERLTPVHVPGRTLILVQPQTAHAVRMALNAGGVRPAGFSGREIEVIETESFFSGHGLSRIVERIDGDALLLLQPGHEVQLGQRAVERMVSVGGETGAGLVYTDFRESRNGRVFDHPTIDRQLGSIRDKFDFGPVILLSRAALEKAWRRNGSTSQALRWGAFYQLWLTVGIDFPMLRIPEFLYSCEPWKAESRLGGDPQDPHFGYVDPKNRDYQSEMERIATEHLRRLGARLDPAFLNVSDDAHEQDHDVTASVVIPVRNRVKTIADAIQSALSQETSFRFNVIVVDNHSTDGTTDVLKQLTDDDSRLIHWIPQRTDLGIGGCWNEAVYSSDCGRYAVQLDSDDLYHDRHVLKKLVSKLIEGPHAMVIGSYTLVDFDLKEIPPGLIDHREWTRENGRNNALRINGLGAPRAFHTPTLRKFGFPNVSYGEDYAVALRISREYEIGRIFESVYLCRRWAENSDAALPLETMNRYDVYKDRLRTIELLARIRLNAKLD